MYTAKNILNIKYFPCINHACTTAEDRDRLGEFFDQRHQSQRKNR